MGLFVIHPGLATTVQDLGRPGYRAWGVPVGGACDRRSAGLANALLGNPPGCAVLELTLLGGTYEARSSLALALAGASMSARVRGRSGDEWAVPTPSAFSMTEGDCLTIGGASRGARAYLGVLGGWLTEPVLGSRSSETRLRAGDLLPCLPGSTPSRHLGDDGWTPVETPLRVIAGPDGVPLEVRGLLEKATYRVGAQSDRMGVRLDGPACPVATDPERVSTPVAPGALQWAGGRPLLLGAACGTMGGYPHLAHVISADLDRVGQLRPGDAVRFETIGLDLARRLDRDARLGQEAWLNRIATAARDHPG